MTGERQFPPGLRDVVEGSELSYFGNAELSFRLRGVTVALNTRWDLSEPAGGGDTHRSVIRGTRAEIRVELGAETGFRRRLSVVPRLDAEQPRAAPDRTVAAALDRTIAAWQSQYPGVAMVAAGSGWEIRVPRELDTGHESHFPLVLDDFLAMVDRGGAPPGLAADTLAKYVLLTQASIEARRAARSSGYASASPT